jgi:hypothetical protein
LTKITGVGKVIYTRNFVSKNQLSYTTEQGTNSAFLLKEFEKLYSRMNINDWLNVANEKAAPKHTYPSAKTQNSSNE